MNFEKCLRCSSEWQLINEETLRRETTSEQREMMIFHKATVRTATALYRRHIPAVIKDWAKPDQKEAQQS